MLVAVTFVAAGCEGPGIIIVRDGDGCDAVALRLEGVLDFSVFDEVGYFQERVSLQDGRSIAVLLLVLLLHIRDVVEALLELKRLRRYFVAGVELLDKEVLL